MSKVVSYKLGVNAPADTDVAVIRFFIDGASNPDFIGLANIAEWPEVREVAASAGARVELVLGEGDLVEGTYSFAIAAVDSTGNQSDAVTKPEWTAVPLDLTAPGVPTNLTIESF